MKLIITIDVEEEGLFSGEYPQKPAGVKNVAELRRLRFIQREFGFPLTLLVTYPVTQDLRCHERLRRWQGDYGAEIGAHLHPWNTPPFADLQQKEPIPSDSIPLPLLRDKLEALLTAIRRHFAVEPITDFLSHWPL